MAKKRILIAVAFAAFVLFAVMASALVIAHEADHDCAGDDCPVCAAIAICQNTLKTLGYALGVVAFITVCIVFLRFLRSLFRAVSFNHSPVLLKVKLLN